MSKQSQTARYILWQSRPFGSWFLFVMVLLTSMSLPESFSKLSLVLLVGAILLAVFAFLDLHSRKTVSILPATLTFAGSIVAVLLVPEERITRLALVFLVSSFPGWTFYKFYRGARVRIRRLNSPFVDKKTRALIASYKKREREAVSIVLGSSEKKAESDFDACAQSILVGRLSHESKEIFPREKVLLLLVRIFRIRDPKVQKFSLNNFSMGFRWFPNTTAREVSDILTQRADILWNSSKRIILRYILTSSGASTAIKVLTDWQRTGLVEAAENVLLAFNNPGNRTSLPEDVAKSCLVSELQAQQYLERQIGFHEISQIIRCRETLKHNARREVMDAFFQENKMNVFRDWLFSKTEGEEPLFVVRAAEGEGYFFSEKIDDLEYLERHWWGNELRSGLRSMIQNQGREAIFGADAIGIPSISRFVRDFRVGQGQTQVKSLLESLHQGLTGANLRAELLFPTEQFNTPQGISTIQEIVRSKSHVVAVTSLGRRPVLGALAELGHERASCEVVTIPSHATNFVNPQEKKVERRPNLAEQIMEIGERVSNTVQPGTLVLISAGSAGKHLGLLAKRAGAQVVDVGSAFPRILGQNERWLY